MSRTPDDAARLVKVVCEHLRMLGRAVFHDTGEATLQAVSGHLRFLLVDGMLARAWKASGIGGPMTFKAWCIEAITESEPVVFCGGGDILPGIPFSIARGARLVEKALNLDAFVRCVRIQAGTDKATTADLVKYVANTLGGAHFDPHGQNPKSHKPVFARLRDMSGDFGLGVSVALNGRDLLHHEVLSVAQCLLRSPEVARLMRWQPADG